MGNRNSECCLGEDKLSNDGIINDLDNKIHDEKPSENFAHPVKQQIELNSKVKEIYLTDRSPHFAERKGSKLQLHYIYEYAAYYEGQWNNGQPHGQGRLVYDDGSLFEGCFKQGCAECMQGLFISPDGDYYRGRIKKSQANGQGEYYASSFNYKGNWLHDRPHGRGIQTYNINSFYEGQFQAGVKQGQGLYQWNPRQYYQGNFKNNLFDGYGKLYMNQYEYEGNFKEGKQQGYGKIQHLVRKWKYKGFFDNNKMHGEGELSWPNGTIWEGMFEQGKQTQGKLKTIDLSPNIDNFS